jgi:very-short-patch-repair endonuclease
VFIPTTLQKLQRAREINDLFHESPLEDDLWEAFKQKNIEAERQWYLKMTRQFYCLDFAIFCRNRSLDVECDGDTWHSQPDRIAQDNERDSALTSHGWAVLRFNSQQVWQKMGRCLDRVCETINHYGGVVTPEGEQKLYVTGNGMPQQMSLLREEPAGDEGAVD